MIFRCKIYAELEKKFGLPQRYFASKFPSSEFGKGKETVSNTCFPRIFHVFLPTCFPFPDDENGDFVDAVSDPSSESENSKSSYILGKKWRDLIPVIKIDITQVRIRSSLTFVWS